MMASSRALSIAILSAVAGCSSAKPLAVWQEKVSRYVATEGNGDPNVLRQVSQTTSKRDARPALITVGELDIKSGPPVWGKSFDVQGVLLGEREIASRHWYFFLTAVLQRRPKAAAGICDVRLMGFCAVPGALRWCASSHRAAPVVQYIAGADAKAGTAQAAFPGALDQFHLAVQGNTVTATDAASGAQWTLAVPSLLLD